MTFVTIVPMAIAKSIEKPSFLVFLKKQSTTASTAIGITKFSSPKEVKIFATVVKKPFWIPPKNLNTQISKPKNVLSILSPSVAAIKIGFIIRSFPPKNRFSLFHINDTK